MKLIKKIKALEKRLEEDSKLSKDIIADLKKDLCPYLELINKKISSLDEGYKLKRYSIQIIGGKKSTKTKYWVTLYLMVTRKDDSPVWDKDTLNKINSTKEIKKIYENIEKAYGIKVGGFILDFPKRDVL